MSVENTFDLDQLRAQLKEYQELTDDLFTLGVHLAAQVMRLRDENTILRRRLGDT